MPRKKGGVSYPRKGIGSSGGSRSSYASAPQGRGLNANTAQYSRNNAANASKYQKKKMSRGKKIGIGIAIALVVILVGVGAAGALYVNSLQKTLSFDDPEEERELREALAPVKNPEDPFYMLLIGSDARGDEAARSDVNILVRVDPANAKVTMVSIPRDTKVTIDGYGTQKINAAYAYGGASLAVSTMSEFAGVPISHYAEIHFSELVQLVDSLGGVEVDVPIAINDPDAGGSIAAGVQTLNGEQSLIFARSRAYADGDFQRTANQRILLEAIINKVLSLPATALPGAIQNLAACVTTDFSVIDLVSLAQKFQAADGMTMYSGMAPSSTAMIDGVSYVITDEVAWTEMMTLVDSGGDPATLAMDETAS